MSRRWSICHRSDPIPIRVYPQLLQSNPGNRVCCFGLPELFLFRLTREFHVVLILQLTTKRLGGELRVALASSKSNWTLLIMLYSNSTIWMVSPLKLTFISYVQIWLCANMVNLPVLNLGKPSAFCWKPLLELSDDIFWDIFQSGHINTVPAEQATAFTFAETKNGNNMEQCWINTFEKRKSRPNNASTAAVM